MNGVPELVMATTEKTMLTCPLCPFEDEDGYVVTLHVDFVHFGIEPRLHQEGVQSTETKRTADDVKVVAAASLTEEGNDEWLPCPENDCGEEILWKDLREHLDLHLAERLTFDDDATSSASADIDVPDPPSDGQSLERSGLSRRSATSSSDSGYFSSSTSVSSGPHRRLGRKELGPHAYEAQMPIWLYKQLSAGGKTKTTQRIGADGRLIKDISIENEISGMVPLLATLLGADSTVEQAWLCHPAVQHIFKLPKEGGFCGYRNIQMMLSFVLGAEWPGCELLRSRRGKAARDGDDRIPGILELQKMIEAAWDMGYNSYARVETGGIKGTRKYIGTPEAQALFDSIPVACRSSGVSDTTPPTSSSNPASRSYKAHEHLYQQVENYFTQQEPPFPLLGKGETSFPSPQRSKSSPLKSSHSQTLGEVPTRKPKVTQTSLPPIFLQQPGHSLTIVGIEVRASGEKNLLVLDPAYKPSPAVEKMLDSRVRGGVKLPGVRKRKVRDKSSTGSAGSGEKQIDRERGDGVAASGEGRQANKLLDAYRRGRGRLGRYREFEMLTLEWPARRELESGEEVSGRGNGRSKAVDGL